MDALFISGMIDVIESKGYKVYHDLPGWSNPVFDTSEICEYAVKLGYSYYRLDGEGPDNDEYIFIKN